MTRYIPETGTVTIPETVKAKIVTGVTNCPPAGTRIRATLGETVIVGKVSKRQSEQALIAVDIKPVRKNAYAGLLEFHTLWIEDGWEFEILDGAA